MFFIHLLHANEISAFFASGKAILTKNPIQFISPRKGMFLVIDLISRCYVLMDNRENRHYYKEIYRRLIYFSKVWIILHNSPEWLTMY